MLVVDPSLRNKGIGFKLINRYLEEVNYYCQVKKDDTVEFIVVDTEEVNESALRLYKKIGFISTKNFYNYYQGGTTGIRLKLYLKEN